MALLTNKYALRYDACRQVCVSFSFHSKLSFKGVMVLRGIGIGTKEVIWYETQRRISMGDHTDAFNYYIGTRY